RLNISSVSPNCNLFIFTFLFLTLNFDFFLTTQRPKILLLRIFFRQFHFILLLSIPSIHFPC
ncbi:hypothetical protein L9F63_012262, partial [Diploptera punctata]